MNTLTTNLKQNASEKDIIKLCEEAAEYKFASVCINPCYVKLAKTVLADTSVKICTVTGFPLGASLTEVKVFETEKAVSDGADEIDTVINVGKVRSGDFDYIENELLLIKNACNGRILKIIIETCLLSDDEKIKICKICDKIGADFVKTSTGFSTGGATEYDVRLMCRSVSDRVCVKAAGGIRTYESAKKMIEAGADRLGTSAGIAIMNKGGEL